MAGITQRGAPRAEQNRYGSAMVIGGLMRCNKLSLRSINLSASSKGPCPSIRRQIRITRDSADLAPPVLRRVYSLFSMRHLDLQQIQFSKEPIKPLPLSLLRSIGWGQLCWTARKALDQATWHVC